MDNIETKVTDFVAKIAPYCAPIPTAYLVGRAAVIYLQWPLLISIIAALVIESLGLATTATALSLYQYNQSKRKIDARAPFFLAASLVIVYFVVVTGLTVILDIYPDLATFAPAIFPALSLTGVTVLALRSDHKGRLEAIAQERAERKANRQAGLSNRQTSMSNTESVKKVSGKRPSNIDVLHAARKAKLNDRLDTLLNLLGDNPDLSVTEAARALGVSRQTLYTYLQNLEAAGKLAGRKNGHGWEIQK